MLIDLMWITPLTHASWGHVAANAAALLILIPPVWRGLGAGRALMILVGAPYMGGIAQLGADALMTAPRPVIGMSAAVFAMLGAYTRCYPHARPCFFCPPAKLLTSAAAGISATCLFTNPDSIAHAAHLAGLLFGMAVAKRARNKGPPLRR
jgi:membrane associated rhomboid family serine protease